MQVEKSPHQYPPIKNHRAIMWECVLYLKWLVKSWFFSVAITRESLWFSEPGSSACSKYYSSHETKTPFFSLSVTWESIPAQGVSLSFPSLFHFPPSFPLSRVHQRENISVFFSFFLSFLQPLWWLILNQVMNVKQKGGNYNFINHLIIGVCGSVVTSGFFLQRILGEIPIHHWVTSPDKCLLLTIDLIILRCTTIKKLCDKGISALVPQGPQKKEPLLFTPLI